MSGTNDWPMWIQPTYPAWWHQKDQYRWCMFFISVLGILLVMLLVFAIISESTSI